MIAKMPPNRSHLEAFCFMRTSRLQRARFADQGGGGDECQDDARVSLLRREDRVEEGVIAPAWAGKVEGLNYQISRVEGKVMELDSLHQRHLSRPTMDEADQEEARISKLTAETTQQFVQCQKQLKSLQNSCKNIKGSQQVVVRNIVINLVGRLQEITEKFRSSQGNYLRKVEAREKRNNQYFTSLPDPEPEDDGLLVGTNSGWNQQDMLVMEENTKAIRRREQEINSIVQSIQDLNTIFRDLAAMVTEQGEVVDRIDYNIENTSIKVEHGLEQLKKASKYQKNNRKMKCILILALTLIFLLFLLVLLKS